jgi:hypothetical protein
LFWTQPYPSEGEPQRPAPTIATVPCLGDRLFLTSFYHGPMMLQLAADRPAVTVLWKDKTKKPTRPVGLHCLMATPVLKDGYIYGVCANGELRCCAMDTGNQLWETYAATGGKKTDCGTAFLIPQGDRFILFNDQGELILANLTPKGYAEIDRATIIEPVEAARGRQVVWSHPAFANRCVFARNNKELVCVSLAWTAAQTHPAPVARGEQPKAPPPNRVDSQVLTVLKQVAELYKRAASLHVEATLASTLTEGEQTRRIQLAATYELKRPNQFALRSKSGTDPQSGLQIVCDGTTLTVHARRLQQYTEAKAPPDLAGIGQMLPHFGHFATSMLFPNVLAEDPDEQILEGVTDCAYLGKEKLGDKTAHRLRFKQPELDWEMWVAAEDKPFVLKVSLTGRTETGTFTTVETYTSWKLDEALRPDAFAVTLPPGTKKVKVLGKHS